MYPETLKTSANTPDSPWAMYLTDEGGIYRFLGFDFDSSKGNAQKDAARFSSILNAGGVRRVATTSGPSGGRHVWIAFAETVSIGLIHELAGLASSMYPSLDISMIKNPRTGAMRPPLSPHRVPGTISQPDAPVDVTPLLRPSTTERQIKQIALHLRDMGAELPTARKALQLRGIVSTATGSQQMKGSRRAPSANVTALLNAVPEDGADLSLVAARILAGLARSRHSFEDVQRLARTAPGLEHFRSMAHPSGGRVPRTSHGSERTLERKWRYALEFVAQTPTSVGDGNEDFEDRAAEVTDIVIACQSAADASAGRWHRAGYKDRLVLDAVCAAMLAATRPEVEMDVRRLALTTGFGRTQTAAALWNLQRDGWLIRTAAADGPNGARFTLAKRFSTAGIGVIRTQAVTPRSATLIPQERELALRHLQLRLERASDGLYAAPKTLGRICGRLAAAITGGVALSPAELALDAGISVASTRYGLQELRRHGLVSKLADGWVGQFFEHTLRRARQIFDVERWTFERTERVGIERYVWAWWSAELQWMRAKGKHKRSRKHAETAVPLIGNLGQLDSFPRYPRNSHRRGDHMTARALAEMGGLTVQGIAALSAA